jgi:hypothetical protein
LFTAPTDVSIRYRKRSKTFSGNLASQFSECESARQVQLKKVRRGPDKTAGNTSSSSTGSWSIKKRKAHGKYYAVALAKTLSTTAGDQIDCQRGRSRTRKVG